MTDQPEQILNNAEKLPRTREQAAYEHPVGIPSQTKRVDA